MINYTNYTLRTLTNDITLVPFSATGSGTIVTDGLSVIGTGTSFTTEMPMGSWIVDLAAGEFRQVVKVTNDTVAYIAQAFTVDLSSAAPEILHAKKAGKCEISVVVPVGNSDGTIITTESSTLPAGLPVNISKAARHESTVTDIVNPCIIDATGTVAVISIMS